MFGIVVVNKSCIHLVHRNYFEIKTHKCKVTSSVLIHAYQYVICKYTLIKCLSTLSIFLFVSKAVTTILITI